MSPLSGKNLRRLLALSAISAIATLAILALDLFTPLHLAELAHQDHRVRHGITAPQDPRLVYLGIDQESYDDKIWEEDIEEAGPRDAKALRMLKTKRNRWTRELWAWTAERLIQDGGAKVVVFDLLFSSPDLGDEALRHAFRRFGSNIVVGSNLQIIPSPHGDSVQWMFPAESLFVEPPAPDDPAADPVPAGQENDSATPDSNPATAPETPETAPQTGAAPTPAPEPQPTPAVAEPANPEPANPEPAQTAASPPQEPDSLPTEPDPCAFDPGADDRVGFVNYFPDHRDGVIREAWFHKAIPGDRIYESLASRALAKLGHPEAVPPGHEPRILRFTGAPGQGYPYQPLFQIFLKSFWEGNYQNGAFFKDKLVLIGPAANFLHDDHKTPYEQLMYGPEIHLQVIGAALAGAFIRNMALPEILAVMAAAGLAAFLLAAAVRQPLLRFALIAAASAAWLWASQQAYNHASLHLFTIPPLIAFTLAGATCLAYEFVLERLEKARVRSTLERYVSRNVVGQILDSPEGYLNSLGGSRKFVTIFFSDIRGFTTMTESADSQALVTQLNEYFTAMVDCVFRNFGTIDKFIGDAVMAVWGNVTSAGRDADAIHAAAACLEMQGELNRLNTLWRAAGRQELQIGMGINSGEVIIGNMGSQQKMEFTAIGDAVNLASRLEGVTKEYGIDLAVGENTAALIASHFVLRTVDLIRVKGKTKPVEVFTIVGPAGEVPQETLDSLALYESGIKDYRARNFVQASLAFQACLKEDPTCALYKLYLDHAKDYIYNPPGEDWDGVHVMTKK